MNKEITNEGEKELLEGLLRLYREWCKETKRNGGVLIGKSITEFFEWFARKHSVTPVLSEQEIKEEADDLYYEGTKTYCSIHHSLQQFIMGNCPLNDVEAAIKSTLVAALTAHQTSNSVNILTELGEKQHTE